MSDPAWIDVRCPYEVVNKKTGRRFACNRLVVRVSAGSEGEGFCPACRKRFEFVIENNRHQVLTESIAT